MSFFLFHWICYGWIMANEKHESNETRRRILGLLLSLNQKQLHQVEDVLVTSVVMIHAAERLRVEVCEKSKGGLN